MSNLKIALVVPNRDYNWDDERHFRLSDLQRACHGGGVDLVVFPESYESIEGGNAQDTVEEWASHFNAPVLMGVESQGFQLAVFHNPQPQGQDTASHLYVKHSSASRLAYEWSGYQGHTDPMFAPIFLKGERLGVQICHDMFYGLIGQRLRGAGAGIFIDLSFGNVKIAKWQNVVRARSLELKGPFLCTMGYSLNGKGKAARALAYKGGRPLVPLVDKTASNGAGDFVIFDIGSEPASADGGQAFTDKVYQEVTISLGTGKPADVLVKLDSHTTVITGPRPAEQKGSWQGFLNRTGKRIGILSMPVSDLWDGVAVHRLDAPEGAFDYHVLLYAYQETPTRSGDLLSLMKMRAIEHRAGIALLAGDVKEVVQTNRFKYIQRFKENNGIFGLNGEWLAGTWSTANYIPHHWFPCYRSLLNPAQG